jgi:thymidylate synthase (FAD)
MHNKGKLKRRKQTMPKNNNLEPVKLPMTIRFGERPTTEFKNNLESIKVELLEAPSMNDLRKYLPQFAQATWSEEYNSYDDFSAKEKDEIIRDVFFGKTLPTALETIGINFRISGISLQAVTHILRHRGGSFSADCSGDKWWTHKAALIPNSIQNSNGNHGYSTNEMDNKVVKYQHEWIANDNFHRRYQKIVEMAKELYCDMIDSKEVSIMDARYILPRCLETFYYMRINLKDTIAFIKQRMDKQIQPETDNIIAYQMYLRLLERYPVASGLINIHDPSWFYIKTARTGKATNLYYPDVDSDKFEWNTQDFIYQCTRDQLNGTDDDATNLFNKLMNEYEICIEHEEDENSYFFQYTQED